MTFEEEKNGDEPEWWRKIKAEEAERARCEREWREEADQIIKKEGFGGMMKRKCQIMWEKQVACKELGSFTTLYFSKPIVY